MTKQDPKTPWLNLGGSGDKIPPPAPKKPLQGKDKETANPRKPPFELPAREDGEGS